MNDDMKDFSEALALCAIYAVFAASAFIAAAIWR